MGFSFGYSPWLLGLSLLLAGSLTYWSYRRTVPALPPLWRWVLGGLRFVSLALICFLLLEPVVQQLEETEQPPILAVLVDNSESMRVVSGEPTDTSAQGLRERLRPVFTSLRDDLPGTAQFFGFDASLRTLSAPSLDSLGFDGSRTDLGGALETVTEELEGENLRGIAVISDGQYNSGGNPNRVADRSSVPIHTITVGDTTRRQDLLVDRVATNDVAYVDSEVPVQVTLRGQDVEGRTTVSLREEGELLQSTEVDLPSGSAEMSIDLSFRPKTAGLRQLTVQAAPVEGEAIVENNRRSVSLRVLDSKRQVLVLGAAPSPNYTAIRRVLERDANTEVTARVPQRDGSFYGGALPDSLSQFDVVVCAGFPSSAVPDETVADISALLSNGTSAVFVLDHQTNVAAWSEHFSDVLPAVPESISLNLTDASFLPVEAERSHPVFQIEDANLGLFEELPPLSVPATAWNPTPDATVIAEAQRPAVSGSSPVLVLRKRAGHRSAILLGTDTWRWSLLPENLSAADPLWPGLISNTLRWVATQSDERQVRVRPDASPFDGDEPVEFTGQVYDESMNPVADATVSVTITDSTGTEYPHTMDRLGNGRYGLDVGTLPEGRYEYVATARRNEAILGRDRGTFSVGALQLEYQQTHADPVLMRQIAARSGGTAYAPETAGNLPSDLASSSSFTSNTVTDTTEAELWRTSLFLIVILVLLAAEWTLRKRFGLT